MNTLAKLIRAGLKSGVVEDRGVWGIASEGGVVRANVGGLALIGALGQEKALELLTQALGECQRDEAADRPATEEIARVLGLAVEECLTVFSSHQSDDATSIADKLDLGEYVFDPA